MSLLDQIEGAARKKLLVSGGCHTCPRKKIDYVPATLQQGPVIWLGEAPGGTEVGKGEGFTGKTGSVLRAEAEAAGIPGPWSFTNTIHCRPPENAPPKPKEITCCLSQFVLDEIRGYPFVVMVGSVPLHALFPGASGSHFRGNFAHHPDFPGQRFYNIYHPSALHRGPGRVDMFKKHLERLGRVVRGEDGPPIHIVRGAQALAYLNKAMDAAPIIAPDFETTTVESWSRGARIKSLCITADGTTVAAADAGEPYFEAILAWLAGYVQRPEKTVVGSNVGFDLEWVERLMGIQVRCSIQELSSVWYEAAQYKQATLKQLVAEQLDGYRWLVHEPHLEKDTELLLRYNAEDVVYSLQLFMRGMAKLRPQTQDLVSRVSGPMALISRQMTTTGLYLRHDYRKEKVTEYQEKRRVAVQAWKDEDPEFLPSTHESGKGLHEYLFKIKGIEPTNTTAGGEASTDKTALKEWVRAGHTYLKHLLTIRSIDKILSTYLTAYDDHVWPDSRLRPNHWMTSTDTSRPSSSSPNVYNIPRVPEIRDLFGVPTGSRMIESDLSQIEFRIMVCRAKDENGIAGYLRGDDAHTMTAQKMVKLLGRDKVTKEDRSNAKPTNFSQIYGGTEHTLKASAAEEYGLILSIEKARQFRQAFMDTYPRIPLLHDECRTKLRYNRGWFESITGHVWHYEDWDSEDQGRRDHAFRAAINSEGQGPASNICFYIAVQTRRMLDERGLSNVRFVNSVYDSIVTEVPDPSRVEQVIGIIEEATQLAHKWVASWFVVPLVIEHAVGESWGSLEPWKGHA